jgi:hypothetical protein
MFIYIIAIAWTYVVLLMSVMETSLTAGVMTFIFYCALPLSISIYLLRAPQRNKLRKNALQAPLSILNEIAETKDTSPNNNIRENT